VGGNYSRYMLVRGVMEWKQMGRRNRGRPRKRWIEDIEKLYR
jgi:hypothetical protein